MLDAPPKGRDRLASSSFRPSVVVSVGRRGNDLDRLQGNQSDLRNVGELGRKRTQPRVFVDDLDDHGAVAFEHMATVDVRRSAESDERLQDRHSGKPGVSRPRGDNLIDLAISDIGGLVGVDAEQSGLLVHAWLHFHIVPGPGSWCAPPPSCGSGSCRAGSPRLLAGSPQPSTTRAMAGRTSSVRMVAAIRPPITVVAKGFCTSAPVPCASAIGTKPIAGTNPVMTTARILSAMPLRIASAIGAPFSIRSRIAVITTSPFSTATPARQMNPTAADTEKAMPVSASVNTPPASPKGTAKNTAPARANPPNAM